MPRTTLVFSESKKMYVDHLAFKTVLEHYVFTEEFTDEPVLVVFNDAGHEFTMYFDRNKYYEHFVGNMSFHQLYQETKCEGVYRNTTQLKTEDEEEIETHCLWFRRGAMMQLLDDDAFVECVYDEKLFRKIESKIV
jgi:hypothetical protein